MGFPLASDEISPGIGNAKTPFRVTIALIFR
jgi:hypothetical protein